MRIIIFLTIIVSLAKPIKSYSQWTEISYITTKNLVDGCFINDSTAIIISQNGAIFKSHDNGHTWNNIKNINSFFTKIYAASEDTIFAGGINLYKSTDQGFTWNFIKSFNQPISDLDFFNSKIGYIIIPQYDTIPSSWGEYGYIVNDNYKAFKTVDFGSNWNIALHTGESNNKMQITDFGSAFISCDYIEILAHGCGPWVDISKRTSDFGETWNLSLRPTPSHVFDFINDSIGYFINWGSIVKTVIGTDVPIVLYDQFIDYSVKDCFFLSEVYGVIISDYYIFETTTGGYSLTTSYTSEKKLNRVFSNKKGNIICIGENGLILTKKVDLDSLTYINFNNEIPVSTAFPNPFIDFVKFEIDLAGECEIFVYDILSQFIYQNKFIRFITIETSDFNKGAYIYIIKNNGKILKKGKILKI